ncbi:hypothetical protein MML48_4g00006719 [Holotrichia oblita]|uniref:Uncharacterized protein n=1 Tax=Holotrichia oblita TaxID=644536 RepID=A0ACB9TAW3_HOLOL|nr:hypothetical protein MML48_4g00006719 [Holotrichia oblita]
MQPKNKFNDNDIVENLKSQIHLLMKEKESTTELWKNSLETIDHLEDELRLYEGRSHGYVSKTDVRKMKDDYQKRIKELEIELMQVKVSLLESQKSTKSIIDLKTNELKQLNESHQETSKAVQNLQDKIEGLQQENQNLQAERDKLRSSLQEKNKLVSSLRGKEKESQLKVSEAIQVVEAALFEKDAALYREKQAKELEKEKNTSKVLEERLDIIQKGNLTIETSSTSKLLMLEKNLESTFQNLLLSEKKNIQLEAENKSIKDDLEQMANMYNRDIKTRESEKVVLENKISALQNDLDVSNSSLVHVATKMEEVNSKLLLIETDLKKQLHLKDVKNEKILSNKIKEIEIANAKLNKGVKKRLEDQIQFNKKWKATMNDIIQKLEKRVNDLKQESHSLRQSKKELRQKLREAEEQLNEYKERLKSLCLDVTKVANFSKEHFTATETNPTDVTR